MYLLLTASAKMIGKNRTVDGNFLTCILLIIRNGYCLKQYRKRH